MHKFGNKFVEKLKTWKYDTSKAINMHGYIQVMTIQKIYSVVEVQLHCGVNVHLRENELKNQMNILIRIAMGHRKIHHLH